MEFIAMGFVGILAVFVWGTVQYGLQAVLLSLIPSFPLGTVLSTLAVTMYCSQSGESICGLLVVLTFPIAVVLACVLTLLKLYNTSMFKPYFGFVIGATIVLVIFGNYFIYSMVHFVTMPSVPVFMMALVGAFVGAYISSANLPSGKLKGDQHDYRA